MTREQRSRSYSSFGLFRDDQEVIRRNAPGKSKRFFLSFAVVTIALLIVTAVFIAQQVTKSTTRESIAKAKRFTEEPLATTQKDVSIIPSYHPNHRYDREQPKDQIMQRMMKNIYKEWSLDDDPKARNNIRDIIKRIEMREKLRKATEKRNPREMGKPILFKGVYTKKAKTDRVSVDDSNTEYFKKINEMLMGEEKSPTEEKRLHSVRGSPFQLKNQEATENEIWRKMKKPITVMLDVYPITNEEMEEMGKRKQQQQQQQAPVFLSEPVPSGGINVPYSLPPSKKRMIMKLNLYPKRMNRRTFGWFKKPESRVCHLLGHGSKPVTAEWKDEHGNWVKANYVTLKYWDRKYTG